MKMNANISEAYSKALKEMKSQSKFLDIVARTKNDDGEMDFIRYTNAGELVQRSKVVEFMLDVVVFMNILRQVLKIYYVEKDPVHGEIKAEEVFKNFKQLKYDNKIPSEINDIYNDGISLIGRQLNNSNRQRNSAGCGCWLAFFSIALFFYEWWLGIVAPIILFLIFRPRGSAYELMLRGSIAVSMLCGMHPLFSRACKSVDLVYDDEKYDKVEDFLNKPYVSIHELGSIKPEHEYFDDKDPALVDDVLTNLSIQKEILSRLSK